MKRLLLILSTLLICSSAWAATKVQVMTGGKIDVDKLPTVDFSLESDPASPIDGQIWWNETDKLLKVADPSGVYAFTGTLTAWDTTPSAFSFADIANATAETTYTSDAITVAGINHPVAITVAGDASAKYSVNNATATAVNGTVVSGDEVQAVVTSSASDGTAVNATVTIGGVSDVFEVATTAEATVISDDFSTDTRSNYTQLHASYKVGYDATNDRLSGPISDSKGGLYYNTEISSAHYVRAKIYKHDAASYSGLIIGCDANGTSSTGYVLYPASVDITINKLANGTASVTYLSAIPYSGAKTWGNTSSYTMMATKNGGTLSVYVDWNDDGDFDDTDEYVGSMTDSSYSGSHVGVYLKSSTSWADNFVAGALE